MKQLGEDNNLMFNNDVGLVLKEYVNIMQAMILFKNSAHLKAASHFLNIKNIGIKQ